MAAADPSQKAELVLVLSAMAGDLRAFDELVTQYRPAVYRQLRAAVGPELAQDATQDAFVQAFRALPQLGAPEAFGSWLRRIAARCAIRRGKGRAKRQSVEAPLDEVVLATCPSLNPGPEDTVIGEMTRERAMAMARQLPEPYRETVELRFAQDMPLKRIAAYQGISDEGVKWRLRRALDMLRERRATEDR